MAFLGTLLGSILMILFGLAIALYGYGVFRMLLPVVGFVAGLLIGRAIFPDQPVWGWIFGIGLALIFAVVAYAYWSVMIGISGAILGFTLGTALFHMIGFWDWIALLAGLALGVVFGFLYFRFRDLFVMASTALTGAALVLYGIGYFIPFLSFLKDQGNWFTVLLTLALGVVATLAQMQIFSGMTYYSEIGARTPPPTFITRSNPT